MPRTFPPTTPWIQHGQKGAPGPAQDIPTSHGPNVGSLTEALSWSHAHGAACHPAGDTGVPGEAQPCPARLLLGTAAIRAKHGALGRAGEADNLQAQAVTACSVCHSTVTTIINTVIGRPGWADVCAGEVLLSN